MSKTRNLSDLLDANGDVKSTALDNVPASNDASALTTGTLDSARLGTVTNFSSTGIDDNATSTAVTIDSSGNVGIGTTTPDLGFGGTYLEVANLSQTPSITIRSDRAGGGTLQFADQDDNNPGYISYQHNNDRMVFRAGDNQQVYIDGAGCMMLGTFTPGSAGNGDLVVNGNIYLGGTGSANALDDYEEGTWTPDIKASGTAFSSIGFSQQSGYYTKIGRMVIAQGIVTVISLTLGSASGNINIGSLPFNVSNSGLAFGSAMDYVGNVDFNGGGFGTINIGLQVIPNSTVALPTRSRNLGNADGVPVAYLRSNSTMNFCCIYNTDS